MTEVVWLQLHLRLSVLDFYVLGLSFLSSIDIDDPALDKLVVKESHFRPSLRVPRALAFPSATLEHPLVDFVL